MESAFGLLFLVAGAVWVLSLVFAELRFFHHNDWSEAKVLRATGGYVVAWLVLPALILLAWSIWGVTGD